MVLLELLGVALGAAAVNSAAKKHQQKANPKLNRTKFDAQNAEHGVVTSSAGFIEQRIMDIAARCGVRPNKHGVLPEYGYEHCINYVTENSNNKKDIENFERDWRLTVGEQLKRKAEKLKDESSAYYERAYWLWHERDCNIADPNNKITIKIKHWKGLPKETHLKRINNLYENTLLKEHCVKPPILRNDPLSKDSHIEVWVFKGYPWQRQGSWIAQNGKRTLYEGCCKHLGYDPML